MQDPATEDTATLDDELPEESLADDSPFQLTANDLFAIDVNFLKSEEGRNFDLYTEGRNTFVLYRSANDPFTERDAATLERRGGRVLYVLRSERDKYLQYVERGMLTALVDDRIPMEDRAVMLRDMSVAVISDLAKNPGSKQSMVRSRSMVEGITRFVNHAPEALQSLFLNRNMDAGLASRAVNCCVFSIGLSGSLGITNAEDIRQLGLGCLLKDIGMLLIPDRLVNKPAPLSQQEWVIVRRHPELTMRLVAKTGGVPPIARDAILQHHERLDGSGYPNHLSDDQISLAGRIAAVVDIFDALTTDRPHAKAMTTFAALSVLQKDAGIRIDAEVFRQLVKILGA